MWHWMVGSHIFHDWFFFLFVNVQYWILIKPNFAGGNSHPKFKLLCIHLYLSFVFHPSKLKRNFKFKFKIKTLDEKKKSLNKFKLGNDLFVKKECVWMFYLSTKLQTWYDYNRHLKHHNTNMSYREPRLIVSNRYSKTS